MKNRILFIAFCLFFSLTHAQNKDVEGSKDYDLLPRMPDYNIRKYWDYQFDSYLFQTSKTDNQTVEGRKFILRYEHKNSKDRNVKKPSYLQILRNYSVAIKKAGGTVLFEHRNAEVGFYHLKTSKGKEVWVEVRTAPDLGKRYTLTIIEKEIMNQDIVVDADLIKEKIDLEGKIAIYGIYFDTGKSIIKEESKPSLEQIGKFLNKHKNIHCWIVGHTDTDGAFDMNIKLSEARAKSVRDYLIKHYSVDTSRLLAKGVGPLSPVSSNSTEEGKKLNRRVELVKQ